MQKADKFKVTQKTIVIPNVQEDQDFVAALEAVKQATGQTTNRKAVIEAVFACAEMEGLKERFATLEANVISLKAQVEAKEIILEAVTKAKSIAA